MTKAELVEEVSKVSDLSKKDSEVIVETVFTIHGLGSQLVRSVGFRDYFTVQGLALVFAVIVMAVNLLADFAYMLIDRRVTAG